MLLVAFALFVTVAFSQCPSDPLGPGDHDLFYRHDSRNREYKLHVPRLYNNNKAYGLVFAFHGYTQNIAWMERASEFSDYSDETNNFIVAYVQGVGDSWNAGSCCGTAVTQQIDDFGFVRELVGVVSEQVCIDPEQVFTTGFSNGCFLSQGLICKAPDLFAASACGSGGEILLTDCDRDFERFNTTLNILEIHGTSDPIVPYNGSPLLGFPDVQENYAEHVERLNCRNGPRETYDEGNYRCEEHYNCDGGSVVGQCVVTRGTHQWFDSNDFKNSEFILDFFGLRPLDKKIKHKN